MNEGNKKGLRNSRVSKIEEVVGYPDHPRQGIQNELPDEQINKEVIHLMEFT